MRHIKDARLDIIFSIIEKMATESVPSSTGNDLFASMTIAETSLIAAVIMQSRQNQRSLTEQEFVEICEFVDNYMDILKLVGVPLGIPNKRLSPAQKDALDKGQAKARELSHAVMSLKQLWAEANAQ